MLHLLASLSNQSLDLLQSQCKTSCHRDPTCLSSPFRCITFDWTCCDHISICRWNCEWLVSLVFRTLSATSLSSAGPTAIKASIMRAADARQHQDSMAPVPQPLHPAQLPAGVWTPGQASQHAEETVTASKESSSCVQPRRLSYSVQLCPAIVLNPCKAPWIFANATCPYCSLGLRFLYSYGPVW